MCGSSVVAAQAFQDLLVSDTVVHESTAFNRHCQDPQSTRSVGNCDISGRTTDISRDGLSLVVAVFLAVGDSGHQDALQSEPINDMNCRLCRLSTGGATKRHKSSVVSFIVLPVTAYINRAASVLQRHVVLVVSFFSMR